MTRIIFPLLRLVDLIRTYVRNTPVNFKKRLLKSNWCVLESLFFTLMWWPFQFLFSYLFWKVDLVLFFNEFNFITNLSLKSLINKLALINENAWINGYGGKSNLLAVLASREKFSVYYLKIKNKQVCMFIRDLRVILQPVLQHRIWNRIIFYMMKGCTNYQKLVECSLMQNKFSLKHKNMPICIFEKANT